MSRKRCPPGKHREGKRCRTNVRKNPLDELQSGVKKGYGSLKSGMGSLWNKTKKATKDTSEKIKGW